MDLGNHIPEYMRNVIELSEIFKAEQIELNELYAAGTFMVNDAYIESASDARIREWERRLKNVPVGTLAQKKAFITSLFRGSSRKLNEEGIKSIVKAFTGGGSKVTFSNSTFNIEVFAPVGGVELDFTALQASLVTRIPAHLGMYVFQNYRTWNEIKVLFPTWNDAKETTWKGLLLTTLVQNLYIDENNKVWYRQNEDGNAILIYIDGKPYARLIEGG